ncbi:RseA family anti-sigma factor [Neisseria perflava]|uniref:RseA family anti-sigma factor n=1 Tax=Neisseria perflava TaxID=33053 RepID=UPI0020A0042A|nr:RseA family anti-sigma factor [Neisseria perflava]MCP1660811.1 negative regulator of sigma E activity [Neisseria perflava]MCP1773208.1 negative regulator of sigma E activity [Neisseria perflava]
MAVTEKEAFDYVSAAMDDEDLSDGTIAKLLADEGAMQKWYEYHLIRDYMQQPAGEVGHDADFMQSEAFQTALAQISAEHRQRHAQEPVSRAQRPVQAANHAFKGFAVAASVLAVAVSVWQFWPQARSEAVPVAADTVVPQTNQVHVVPVNATPDNKGASDTVVPNAAKVQMPERQTTVRVETQRNTAADRQTVVQ